MQDLRTFITLREKENGISTHRQFRRIDYEVTKGEAEAVVSPVNGDETRPSLAGLKHKEN